MHVLNSPRTQIRTAGCLALALAAIYAVSVTCLNAADPKPEKEAKTDAKTEKKVEKKKLTGAELYALNCNRCHPERYPTEWNSAQWKTIMMHMRVRANLPASQAKTIMKYLQEEAGN